MYQGCKRDRIADATTSTQSHDTRVFAKFYQRKLSVRVGKALFSNLAAQVPRYPDTFLAHCHTCYSFLRVRLITTSDRILYDYLPHCFDAYYGPLLLRFVNTRFFVLFSAWHLTMFEADDSPWPTLISLSGISPPVAESEW